MAQYSWSHLESTNKTLGSNRNNTVQNNNTTCVENYYRSDWYLQHYNYGL